MNLNRSKETKAGYKVAYMIFMMFMYIHIFGCIWKQIVTRDEIWIPNMEFIFFGTPQIYEYYYSPWTRQYIYTIYIGFYMFAMGEISPRTHFELIFTIIILLISSLLNGIIIGNMALYMTELHKKKSQFNNKINTVNSAMTNLNLDVNIRREIQEFFVTTNGTNEF